MKLVFRGAFLLVCVLSWGMYRTFKKSTPVKVSREIASIGKEFNFLSVEELKLLKAHDLKLYLNEISEAMVKAGSLNGVFKVNKKQAFRFSLIEKAYAAKFCEIKGLYPEKISDDGTCLETATEGIKILESEKDAFDSENIVGTNLFCPEGQRMCNPALVGFDFSGAKPVLRCLSNASNEDCFKLSTDGEQMKKSLDLLGKVNPEFWKEFEEGINAVCFTDGDFKENDDSCSYIKKQMNHSTLNYRSKLTREYKDLAEKVGAARARTAQDGKACKQFQHEEGNEAGLGDHRNFNIPGQKIFIQGGNCWRLPPGTTVLEVGGNYEFSTPDEQAGDPPLLSLATGAGAASNTTLGTGRFYNFQCGPCNDAANLTRCLWEQRHSDGGDYEKWESLSTPAMDDCNNLISDFENRALPEVLIEKAGAQRQSFYELRSIN
ncbi:MAG: hypothetical protein ACRBBP_00920 [Bdellovibrionales bacterium]